MTLPIQAGQLLWRLPRVKLVALLPLLVNFLVYFAVLVTAVWVLSSWDWNLQGQTWQFWGGFGAWLQKALGGTLNIVKWLLAVPLLIVFCYFTFTSVGMVVASPFNDILSERIELAICRPQNRPSLAWAEQLRLIAVSVMDSLAILLRQVLWMILALPFLLVPYVGFLPLFLVTAYHTGLGFVDVAMARNYLRNVHKRMFIRQRRGPLLGIGLAMELMFLVPLLGLFILPLGVAAGTVLYCRFDWETAFRTSHLPVPAKFVPPKLLTEQGRSRHT
jgi:CysZ protein